MQRGTKKAEEDYAKIKDALVRLHADTQFVPGAGKRKTSDKSTTLKCLLENDDGDGKPIPGWQGPYLQGNLLDPWGNPYGVYQRSAGGRVMGLLLHSNGPDGGRGNTDDIESYMPIRLLGGN